LTIKAPVIIIVAPLIIPYPVIVVISNTAPLIVYPVSAIGLAVTVISTVSIITSSTITKTIVAVVSLKLLRCMPSIIILIYPWAVHTYFIISKRGTAGAVAFTEADRVYPSAISFRIIPSWAATETIIIIISIIINNGGIINYRNILPVIHPVIVPPLVCYIPSWCKTPEIRRRVIITYTNIDADTRP
jgi:hypothetical protein